MANGMRMSSLPYIMLYPSTLVIVFFLCGYTGTERGCQPALRPDVHEL
jgi:hypothetical protein